MSIDKLDDFTHMVSCDFCPETEDFESNDNWSTLMELMKDAGWWKGKDKDSGKWWHKCPECVSNGKKEWAQRKNKSEHKPPPVRDDESFDDEPPLDSYDEDVPASGPARARPAPGEKISCLKYPAMKVSQELCERCTWHSSGYGCTFGEDPEEYPF